MKKHLIFLFTLFLLAHPALAATKTVKLTGKLPSGYIGAAFYSVKVAVKVGTVSGSKFSIIVPSKNLKNGWLYLTKTGNQFGGAVVLSQSGSKSFLQFASTSAKSISLGSIKLATPGYLKLTHGLRAAVVLRNL